tara:strand:+ start:696 stop:1016 length:321 start_codon:yes stop_codon:yes gene_type:complete
MTKLEELTALLVNEISDLKRNVDKLEKINTQLKEIKIKMDLKEYKAIFETYQQKMESHTKSIERFESRFKNKIKQAKIYPTWAVVVFIISLLFSISSVFYVIIKCI